MQKKHPGRFEMPLEEQGQGVSQELELIHLGWVDYNAP